MNRLLLLSATANTFTGLLTCTLSPDLVTLGHGFTVAHKEIDTYTIVNLF